MRITQNTIFNMLRSQLQSNSTRLMNAQQTVATEKKFNYLSEDPIDGGRVLSLNTALASSEQYDKNIDTATSLAGTQDTTLGTVNDILSRAKTLLLQEANQATSTATTREAARIEIAQLTSQLVQASNTQFNGQYIFSGYNSSSPAFSDASVAAAPAGVTGGAVVTGQQVQDVTQLNYHNYQIQFTSPTQYTITDVTTGAAVAGNQNYTSGQPIQFAGLQVTISDQSGTPLAGDTFAVSTAQPGTYMGDGQVQQVEIQAGVRVAQNIPGNRLFQGAGVTNGVDLFATMNSINLALAGDDTTAMNTDLDKLDAAQTQVSNERSAVGSRENLLTTAKASNGQLQDTIKTTRSGLEDADITDAITELSKQQNTYQATLGAAAQIVQPSLLDFLK